MSVEELRKNTRRLEGAVEEKLVHYSKAGTMVGDIESAPLLSSDLESMERSIAQLLSDLERCNEELGKMSAVIGNHIVTRHREILQDYVREFKKTRQAVEAARSHAELLSSVRGDIAEGKSAASHGQALLRERNSLHNSVFSADQVIGQAQAAKEALLAQRGAFLGAMERMQKVGQTLPVVGGLIGRIQLKKKRDQLILMAVVAVLLSAFLWYAFW